jgi:hypothetical protein
MHLPHIISIASLSDADIEHLAHDAHAQGLGRDACPFAHESRAARRWLAAFALAADAPGLAPA